MKRITVVLPVHNGGNYIKECVDSILGQTFEDFDLVVLENASTDGTVEYLNTISDPRLSIFPSSQLLPIERNWERILSLKKGEYLTTVGHDDVLDPNFLETINGLIFKNPDAGLYLTHYRLIDKDGNHIRPCRPIPTRETAANFLASRLCGIRDSFATGHVIRSSDYDALGGIPTFHRLLSADDALILLAIRNRYLATSQVEAFSSRHFPESMWGSTSVKDRFQGLETYSDFLKEYQKETPEVTEVLKRFFGRSAFEYGIMLQHDALLSRDSTNETLNQTQRRVSALTESFGSNVPPPAGISATLRRKALASSFYRLIYRTWDSAARLRFTRGIARLLLGPIG